MTKNITLKNKKLISEGIEILKQGGVIAFPTETVYGLAANMNIPGAVDRIYRIKGRSRSKALPLMLSSAEQLKDIALPLSIAARLLIKNFWPGPLTLIVKKSKTVPDSFTSGSSTVGVRVSSHPIALAVITGLGCPVTGTSANLSGRPNSITAEDVRDQMGDKVDLVIDGGRCPGGLESTIVDVTGDIPVILRQGAIPEEIIQQIIQIKS